MPNDESAGFEACAHCDTPFECDTRYPAVVDSDEDGELNVYSFCDEDCQTAWAGGD